MRRSLMLVMAMILAALVFAPAAFAQDDNPTADDMVASPTATATPTAIASSTASATHTSSSTPTATASATTSPATDTATALPDTGGTPMGFPLPAASGVLLIGSGILAAILLRRRTS